MNNGNSPLKRFCFMSGISVAGILFSLSAGWLAWLLAKEFFYETQEYVWTFTLSSFFGSLLGYFGGVYVVLRDV